MIENSEKKMKTYIFINNLHNFLEDSAQNLHENGIILLRKEIMKTENIPHIELNINEV